MSNEDSRELLVSICYGDTKIDQVNPQRLIDAITLLLKENDELRKIQRTEQGEEIVSDDEIVKDEEQYL